MTSKNTTCRVDHETLIFERTYKAPPARVFAAFADVNMRSRWAAPSADAAIVYSESQFAVGGVDRFRCGAKDDLRFIGEARYADIIENRRIVFVETISTEAKLLGVSLVTWELSAAGAGTNVRVTDQVTSIDGADMASGTRFGMNAALDNLGQTFEP